MQGAAEWRLVTSSRSHVKKIGDLKYFECPLSLIRPSTWKILALVNDTTNAEGDVLPLFEGHPALAEIRKMPEKWRSAVQIVRAERARHRQEEMKKMRDKHG